MTYFEQIFDEVSGEPRRPRVNNDGRKIRSIGNRSKQTLESSAKILLFSTLPAFFLSLTIEFFCDLLFFYHQRILSLVLFLFLAKKY